LYFVNKDICNYICNRALFSDEKARMVRAGREKMQDFMKKMSIIRKYIKDGYDAVGASDHRVFNLYGFLESERDETAFKDALIAYLDKIGLGDEALGAHQNQESSLARFLQKQEEHEAKRKMLDAQPPEVIEVVQLGEKKEYPPIPVPAPTFSERLEAALVTMAWQGESGERTRLVLMHPDTNIDPVYCRREAARVVFYALDTVAWTVPPQVIEQIEQRLSAYHSFE
jgi:hypothetical protein